MYITTYLHAGYKNRHSNAHLRAATMEIRRFKGADSTTNFMFIRNMINGYTRMSDSILVGDSPNKGLGGKIKVGYLTGQLYNQYTYLIIKSIWRMANGEGRSVTGRIQRTGRLTADKDCFLTWRVRYTLRMLHSWISLTTSFPETGSAISNLGQSIGN